MQTRCDGHAYEEHLGAFCLFQQGNKRTSKQACAVISTSTEPMPDGRRRVFEGEKNNDAGLHADGSKHLTDIREPMIRSSAFSGGSCGHSGSIRTYCSVQDPKPVSLIILKRHFAC